MTEKRLSTPHERGSQIERIARALCRHAYAHRDESERVSPTGELWMRMIPEAEVALEAMESVQSERAEWKPGEPRVVCAAIRDRLGRIVTGARHFDAVMMEQIRRTVPDQDAFRTAEQGFIDQLGNFLTREEAMVIATKLGQIIRDDEGRQSLYSENLY